MATQQNSCTSSVYGGIRQILAGVANLYLTYPTISLPSEQCAYYRTQNKRFRLVFLCFLLGLFLVQISANIALVLDETSFPSMLFIMLHQGIVDLLFLAISAYVFRLGAVTRAAKKDDFATQESVWNRYTICGMAPTGLLMATPFFAATHYSQTYIEICWTLCCLLQIQLAAWNVGRVLYKIVMVFVFSVGYCYASYSLGMLKELILLRMTIPVAMAITYILVLDRHNKQNFLLKHALKRQRDVYQHFFQQLQDPLLIIGPATLVFQNSSAAALLGTTKFNYYTRLREFVTSQGWSLEDHVRARLDTAEDGGEPDSGTTQQERYEWSSAGSGGMRSFRQDESPGKRVMRVTIIESSELSTAGIERKECAKGVASGTKKSVVLIIHDITDELLREEKRAEDKYKNMLLFSLSHELKTPLNIFQIFMTEAKKIIPRTDPIYDLFTETRGAWRYLRNKINDILDYAQILSGEFVLHPSSFSTARFVKYLRKITSFLLTTKRRRTVALEFRAEKDVPSFLYADRERIEQVLFNLLSNAAKFTDTGKIELHISRGTQDETAVSTSASVPGYIMFSVRDTGCGMPQDRVDSLFTLACGRAGEGSSPRSAVPLPLLRSESKSSHRQAAQLSGLGLTVSKMICTRMGTEIAVTSAPGKGSSFMFRIPSTTSPRRSAARSPSRATHTPKREGSETPDIPDEGDCIVRRSAVFRREVLATQPMCGSRSTRPAKLWDSNPKTGERVALVVDDSDFNRCVAERMIKKFGFRTISAENGAVAIDALRKVQDERNGNENTEEKTVLIFMDVDMPVMDGIEATVRIRREDRLPRPVIVALTAFSAESERQKCFEAGMDYFMDKPLTKERLCEVLYNAGVGKAS